MSSPSAEQLASYCAEHERKVAYIMDSLSQDNWTRQKTDGNLTVFSRSVDDSKFIQTKTVVKMDVPKDAMIDVMTYGRVYTLETCPQGPIPPQEIFAICDTKDDHETILYFMAMESPAFMVAPREFLLLRRTYSFGEKRVFAQMSIDNDQIKPKRKGFVRGTILGQAFVVEDDTEHAGHSIMTVFSHVDPGGSVPAWAVNFSVKNQMDGLKFIANKAESYWKETKK